MNSRYTPMLAAVLLAALSSATAHAQADDQPPAPPAPPVLARPLPPPTPSSAVLRYKFAVGQVIRYRTVTDIDMKITDTANNRTVPVHQRWETVTQQKVRSVDAKKDAATLATTIESIKALINNQPLPTTETQKMRGGAPIMMVVSSTGKLLKFNFPATSPGLDTSKIAYQQTGAFPATAVKTGSVWNSIIGVSGVGATVTSRFQMNGLAPDETGALIAQIQQNAKGALSSKTAAALPPGFTLNGTIAMTGDLQFDVTGGSIKSQTTKGQFNATVLSSQAAAKKAPLKKAVAKKGAKQKPAVAPAPAAAAGKVHLDITSTTTRLDGDAPAAAPEAAPAPVSDAPNPA